MQKEAQRKMNNGPYENDELIKEGHKRHKTRTKIKSIVRVLERRLN